MSGQALLKIKDKQWAVDIAGTPWEQSQGLGGLSGLPAGTGMLFDLGYEKTIEVTTAPMLFPLDIAFLSDNLIITEIYRNIEPGYLVTSQQPARYFIEVNGGELDGVASGDQASVEILSYTEVMQTPDWTITMTSFIGFAMMGTFVINLVNDFSGEPSDKSKILNRIELTQSESDLLKPCKFPKRTQALNKLNRYEVVHVHDDGDLTVRSRGKLYVVTTEGELFEQKTYSFNNSKVAVCENVSPRYYDVLSWVGVPVPDYSFAIEPEVKERKIDEVLKRLKDGVNSIQESGQFKQFLLTMAKFHDYSIGNMILIMVQKPDASRVAGFNTWKNLGRWVKKGEKGISILAPCFPPKPEKTEPKEEEPEKEIEINPIFFKVVHVFDVSQTEGDPLPEFEVQSLTGEANEELFDKAVALTEKQGLELSFESRPYQDPAIKGTYSGKSIWVRPEESRAQQLKTLLHEIAHHFSESVFRIPRRDAETIAESVAFTVGAHFGFDSGERSFSYVALWAEDKKVLEVNLTAIRKVSTRMIEVLESVSTGELAIK
jgi:uncharacterized membrane protein (UPF0127 family)/antirestriction protein ArdC